jgi:predicted MFS family arabinose efflux permease
MSRLIGWLILFIIGSDLFVVSPLLPQISASGHVSVSEAAWMVTAFALAYIVGGPILGNRADRIGHRRILITAMIVFVLANLLTAIPSPFGLLVAARVLAGAAASGVTPTVYAMIGSSAPEGERGRWLATVTSGLLLALATGAPAGTLLASALGWRLVFVVLAAATAAILLAFLLHARAFDRTESSNEAPAVAVSQTRGERSPVAMRLRAVLVTALWALAVYGLYTYLGTILSTYEHLGAESVAAALVSYGLGAVVGNLVGGKLSDSRDARVVSVVALLLLAVVEGLFGAALHESAAILFAALGAFALVAYPFFPSQQARLVAQFGRQSGAVLAWNNSAMYVGILVGSVAGGPVLRGLGPAAVAWATAAIALVAAAVSSKNLPSSRRPTT